MHIDKNAIPTKIGIPGATARVLTHFGDATDYGTIAGEYFSLDTGTDIAPLLEGLDGDTCHSPHWGYLLQGEVEVVYQDGCIETCHGGEIFYWPPGHSVRVLDAAEIVLFSPQAAHGAVLDHMSAKLADA